MELDRGTRLALQRTLTAVLRTSLSSISFGFGLTLAAAIGLVFHVVGSSS